MELKINDQHALKRQTYFSRGYTHAIFNQKYTRPHNERHTHAFGLKQMKLWIQMVPPVYAGVSMQWTTKHWAKKKDEISPPLTTFERRNYDFQRAVISQIRCSCFSVYLPPSLSLFLSNIATQSLTVFLSHHTLLLHLLFFFNTHFLTHPFYRFKYKCLWTDQHSKVWGQQCFLNNCFLLSKAAFILSKYSEIVNNY